MSGARSVRPGARKPRAYTARAAHKMCRVLSYSAQGKYSMHFAILALYCTAVAATYPGSIGITVQYFENESCEGNPVQEGYAPPLPNGSWTTRFPASNCISLSAKVAHSERKSWGGSCPSEDTTEWMQITTTGGPHYTKSLTGRDEVTIVSPGLEYGFSSGTEECHEMYSWSAFESERGLSASAPTCRKCAEIFGECEGGTIAAIKFSCGDVTAPSPPPSGGESATEPCEICSSVKEGTLAGHGCVTAAGEWLSDTNDDSYGAEYRTEAQCAGAGVWTPYSCEEAAEYWRDQAVPKQTCEEVTAFWLTGGEAGGCCLDHSESSGCGGGCVAGIISGCFVPVLLCILWLSGAFASKGCPSPFFKPKPPVDSVEAVVVSTHTKNSTA